MKQEYVAMFSGLQSLLAETGMVCLKYERITSPVPHSDMELTSVHML